MNPNWSLLFACLALLYNPAYGNNEFPIKTQVRNLPEFRASLSVGIIKEESLDLNGDDNADHVVYSTGGEEIFLSVLLANVDGFAVWHFPVAANYKIVRAGTRYQVILEFDTFPLFGILYGSDQHQWFDHYEFNRDSVILANSKHKPFYKNQQKLYKARLAELKERQRQMEQSKSDDDLALLEYDRIKALIERYTEWIQKTAAIVNAK